MQAIVRPEYILLATMDLRFPIPTPNWMMPFLSSTGWQVTYWFILLRRPSTNRELESSIFIHFCWVSPHKNFNYILAKKKFQDSRWDLLLMKCSQFQNGTCFYFRWSWVQNQRSEFKPRVASEQITTITAANYQDNTWSLRQDWKAW
jgi:hypothetical protein